MKNALKTFWLEIICKFSLFELHIIFNKLTAISTFFSIGDVSIICNNNLGHPALTILLQKIIFFSAKNIKLFITEKIRSSSSIIFLNNAIFILINFSIIFSSFGNLMFVILFNMKE